MADQGRWFKLWTTAADDPDLANLSLEDFGRWCLLGTYLKVHGDSGRLTVKAPGTALLRLFRLTAFQDLERCVMGFPNCAVTPVTDEPVSISIEWKNWHKYQHDYSSPRVAAWRQRQRQSVTTKKRREEKRREEDTKPLSLSLSPTNNGHGHTVVFQIPQSVQEALRKAPWLGEAPKLRTPAFWQSIVRAFPGVEFAPELLKAESWCQANPGRAPKKDRARFVHKWMSNAHERLNP